MSEAAAYILFEGLPTIDGKTLVADLGWRWPGLASPTNLVKGEDDVGFAIGEAVVLLATMYTPIDSSDFEERRVIDKLWPAARTSLLTHQSHIRISVVLEQRRKIDLMTIATQVTASAIAASADPLGVYWPAAPQLISAREFTQQAGTLPARPIQLWVDINVGKGRAGTCTAVTSGLAAFGLREMEAVDVPETKAELGARLNRLVDQVLAHRRNVADGAVLEVRNNVSVTAAVGQSSLGREHDVTRVLFTPLGEEVSVASSAAGSR